MRLSRLDRSSPAYDGPLRVRRTAHAAMNLIPPPILELMESTMLIWGHIDDYVQRGPALWTDPYSAKVSAIRAGERADL